MSTEAMSFDVCPTCQGGCFGCSDCHDGSRASYEHVQADASQAELDEAREEILLGLLGDIDSDAGELLRSDVTESHRREIAARVREMVGEAKRMVVR